MGLRVAVEEQQGWSAAGLKSEDVDVWRSGGLDREGGESGE